MPISLWKRLYHRPSLYPSTAALRSATAGRAGWDMELEENSRRKHRLSPNFRRWNHRKWPWHAPAKKAKGVQGAHGAAATSASVPAPPPATAPADATDASAAKKKRGPACAGNLEVDRSGVHCEDSCGIEPRPAGLAAIAFCCRLMHGNQAYALRWQRVSD